MKSDLKLNALILEDEERILHKLKSIFEDQGYDVAVSKNIQDCLFELSTKSFDLLILDRMIATEDSVVELKNIKKNHSQMAILVLSAIDSPLEKANVLDLGADDYLAKPFETVELVARARKIIRKNEMVPISLQVGDLILNFLNVDCICQDVDLNLSSKEFLILKLLGSKLGKIYNKENIMHEVWGYSLENKTNLVESNINSLRRKIEFSGSSIQIKNTRFVGYWIEV